MWLFGPTTPAPSEFSDDKSFKDFKTKLESAIEDSLDVKMFQTFFVELNDEATKLQRNLSSGVKGYGVAMEQTIYRVMKDNQDLALTMDEVVGVATTFAEEFGRIPNLQDDVIQGMKSLSIMTGIGVKELAKSYTEFDKLGMSQSEAQGKMTKIFYTAKAYGVNAKALTGDVIKNLDKANTYQFKNGVEGLTRMAARAKQLGIDFENIIKFADDALDPDKAIEMASSMQMLGGNVGALGDPFKLLYMAQNDLEGLQNEFIKVTAASAEYNKETGEFKIGTQQMYRLKAMAKELNLDYGDLAKSAIKARKEQEIMPEIKSNLTDEQKKFVASLAEKRDGKWEVQIPGTERFMDVSQVTADQLKEFENAQKEVNKTDGERLTDLNKTAIEQRSLLEQQTIELRKISTQQIFGKFGQDEMAKRGEGTYGEVLTNFKNMTVAAESASQQIKLHTASLFTAYMKGLNRAVNATNQWVISVNGLQKAINDTQDAYNAATSTDETPVITEPTPAGNNDVFIPSSFKGKNLVKGDFGEFTTNPKDDFLAAPNIGEFLNDAQGAFSILNNMDNMNVAKLGNLQDLLTKNVNLDQLSKVVNVNTTSTNEVKGDVGVNGEVKLKIEGLNGSLANILESDPNFQRMFKENVMNIVNERLSKSYSEKLGNL